MEIKYILWTEVPHLWHSLGFYVGDKISTACRPTAALQINFFHHRPKWLVDVILNCLKSWSLLVRESIALLWSSATTQFDTTFHTAHSQTGIHKLPGVRVSLLSASLPPPQVCASHPCFCHLQFLKTSLLLPTVRALGSHLTIRSYSVRTWVMRCELLNR